MTGERPDWVVIEPRGAPLVISIPHAGTDLLGFEPDFVNPWLARKDTDWRLGELYDFVASLGATLLRTRLSRSIIDVNRDPSGASLNPGQATTELCPTTTFDGELLYRPGQAPDAAGIADRRRLYFDPYHATLAGRTMPAAPRAQARSSVGLTTTCTFSSRPLKTCWRSAVNIGARR